jgi:hypothetical protein
MPCLLALLGFFAPRLVLVILWLTGYSGPAFKTTLWPLLGFFLMPFTTLAYAYGMNSNGSISGLYLVLVVVGVLLDLGTIGGGGRQARRRRAGRA